MDGAYCIAMTTLDDERAAAALAREVVGAKLAACVQILTIRSVFEWEGSVDEAAEFLLLMKTRSDRYEELEAFVHERHGYDVPEILRVPITGGFGPYLAWMDANTSP